MSEVQDILNRPKIEKLQAKLQECNRNLDSNQRLAEHHRLACEAWTLLQLEIQEALVILGALKSSEVG